MNGMSEALVCCRYIYISVCVQITLQHPRVKRLNSTRKAEKEIIGKTNPHYSGQDSKKTTQEAHKRNNVEGNKSSRTQMNKQVCGAESQAELRVLLKLGAKLSPNLSWDLSLGVFFLRI